MPICPNCGKDVTPGALFCGQCGTNMQNVIQNTQPNQQSNQPNQSANQSQAYDQANQGYNQGQAYNQPNQSQNQGQAYGQYGYNPYSNQQWNYYNSYPGTAYGYDNNDIAQNKLIAALSYIPPLFFLPLLCCKYSPFGKFHANQSLVLFLVSTAVGIIRSIISSLFHTIGLYFMSTIINICFGFVSIALTVFMILGIFWAAKGDARKLPILGDIKIIK